jgi:hypothetical protein
MNRTITFVILKAYTDAVDLASFETGLPESTFPEQNPFPGDDLLSKDYWPDPDFASLHRGYDWAVR